MVKQKHRRRVTRLRKRGLAVLGLNLLDQRKYTNAEPILRECLDLREKLLERNQATLWQVANAKSMLGEVLMAGKKPVEAEPLLVAGYEGLRQDENAIPDVVWKVRVAEAIQHLIDLARAKNKPDDVKKWQAELTGLRTKRELRDELTVAAMELGQRGHLQEASERFAKVIQLAPDDLWAWFNQGCLLAYQQDVDSYRKHCKAMWERFGNSNSLEIAALTGETCLLLPEGGDAKKLLAAADRGLAMAEGNRDRQSWFSLLKAVLYRNGAFGDCVQLAQKCQDLAPDPYPPRATTADLLSAMAYQRLGETKKARLKLDLALQRIDADLPPVSESRPMRYAGPSDWLICQTLRREAEGLVTGKEGPGLATAKNRPDDVKKWQTEHVGSSAQARTTGIPRPRPAPPEEIHRGGEESPQVLGSPRKTPGEETSHPMPSGERKIDAGGSPLGAEQARRGRTAARRCLRGPQAVRRPPSRSPWG